MCTFVVFMTWAIARQFYVMPDMNWSKKERPYDYYVDKQQKLMNLPGIDFAEAGKRIPYKFLEEEGEADASQIQEEKEEE